VTVNDGHCGDNRHGFESGFEESKSGDDAGFETDVEEIVTSLAIEYQL